MSTNKMRQLEDAILEILEDHKGKERSITGKAIRERVLRVYGMRKVETRTVMNAVANLRARGYLIAASNAEGGYWMMASKEEYHEFMQRQVWSRIRSLLDSRKAMRASAIRQFGSLEETPMQMELFEEAIR